MQLGTSRAMVTGKPEPNEWEFEGRKGVTYRLEISDGSGNVTIRVTEEVYNSVAPFQFYSFVITMTQRARDNRIVTEMTGTQVQAVK